MILSGGPNSVVEPRVPNLDDLGVRIIGISYGQQLLARNLGVHLHRSVVTMSLKLP